MSEQQQDQSAVLRASYQKLIASKQAERQLEDVKDLIMDAPYNGISDKELIREIKKVYPAIMLTPTKLKQLRAKWASESPEPPRAQKPKTMFPPQPGAA